jgi:hypothetical protein
MPKFFIESEYDMDQALAETMKLVKLTDATLDVGFNNMAMVEIFLENLHTVLLENKITPEDKKFHLNIMVKTNEQT